MAYPLAIYCKGYHLEDLEWKEFEDLIEQKEVLPWKF